MHGRLLEYWISDCGWTLECVCSSWAPCVYSIGGAEWAWHWATFNAAPIAWLCWHHACNPSNIKKSTAHVKLKWYEITSSRENRPCTIIYHFSSGKFTASEGAEYSFLSYVITLIIMLSCLKQSLCWHTNAILHPQNQLMWHIVQPSNYLLQSLHLLTAGLSTSCSGPQLIKTFYYVMSFMRCTELQKLLMFDVNLKLVPPNLILSTNIDRDVTFEHSQTHQYTHFFLICEITL